MSKRQNSPSGSRPEVSLADLEMAVLWVSGDLGFGQCAHVSRADGRVYCTGGEDPDCSDDPPGDVDDPEQYASVPTERDFDLGTPLVFRFVRQYLVDDYDRVREVFSHRGAYSQWKALLDRRGKLDLWHEYRNQAEKHALIEWATEEGFRIVDRQRDGGT